MISLDDYLWFVNDALQAMIEIVVELGDDLANRKLELPGANSPYAVLTHCLGVMEYWGGHVVAGRSIERDRDAEFCASGAVVDLVRRTRLARQQLAADVAQADCFGSLRRRPDLDDADLPYGRTQGGALIHIYEELAQHRGQLEVSRDVIAAEAGQR